MKPLFRVDPHRDELRLRLHTVRRLLDATHAPSNAIDVSRETRGLCIVLLFAAYENLLYSLCRGLLETAGSLRVGSRRLKPGLRLFAAHPALQAVASSNIWESGRKVVETLDDTRPCEIKPGLFPQDSSYMKRSQVRLFSSLFDLGDPARVLEAAWDRIDVIVSQRNAIAHGRERPDEVGRNYSIAELRALVDLWEDRWVAFIDHAGAQAASRDFFRLPR